MKELRMKAPIRNLRKAQYSATTVALVASCYIGAYIIMYLYDIP